MSGIYDEIDDDNPDYWRQRAEAAEARAAELERVLKLAEWILWDEDENDNPVFICPWCSCFDKEGHSPECPRQKALGL